MTAARASAVVSHAFTIARRRRLRSIKFTLFGGEPTIALPPLHAAVQRAKELSTSTGIRARIGMVTNGTYSEHVAAQLPALDSITFSLDGPPAIHDMYRRTRTGEPTAQRIISNVQAARERYRVSLRVTVPLESIAAMQEIADYLEALFPYATQYFEPVMGATPRDAALYPLSAYLSQYLRIVQRRWGQRRMPRTSIVSLSPRTCFCNLGDRTVFLPSGDIIACHRITADDQLATSGTRLGFYDEETAYICEPSVTQLRRTTGMVANSSCAECFCSDYCAGGCPAVKTALLRQISDPLPWCRSIRSYYKKFFLFVLTTSRDKEC